MHGERFGREVRGRFVKQRMVNVWNALPEVVVGVGTIVAFKEHLDRYMSKMGLEGYGRS